MDAKQRKLVARALRSAAAVLKAAALVWKDEPPNRSGASVNGRWWTKFKSTAKVVDGAFYEVVGSVDRSDKKPAREVDVEEWEARFYISPHSRRGVYVLPNGKTQKRPPRQRYTTRAAAKEAAQKHEDKMSAPLGSPEEVAATLTKGQKNYLLIMKENDGMAPADYGTRTERSVRQVRTRMMRELSELGLVHGWKLSPLGHQVADLLGGS